MGIIWQLWDEDTAVEKRTVSCKRMRSVGECDLLKGRKLCRSRKCMVLLQDHGNKDNAGR